MQKEACVAASETERVNAKLALEAAREGIVLLANEGVLPLRVKKVALFGAGARHTAKGGTGSGEVNNRASISVEEGLERCGVQVTTKDWLDDCDKKCLPSRQNATKRSRRSPGVTLCFGSGIC